MGDADIPEWRECITAPGKVVSGSEVSTILSRAPGPAASCRLTVQKGRAGRPRNRLIQKDLLGGHTAQAALGTPLSQTSKRLSYGTDSPCSRYLRRILRYMAQQ